MRFTTASPGETTTMESSEEQPTDNSFNSPVSILPLVISLATLVTIIFAACIIYRKRQNKRSQELARQLRVTERKIDAIGNLKAKKEKELLGLANRKAEYNPPATAPCSSVTSLESHANVGKELEVRFVPTYEIKEEEEMTSPSATEYELKLCEASINTAHPTSSSVPSSYTQSNTEGEQGQGSSSYYCSTCQGSSSTVDVGQARERVDVGGVNSSLAVECGTIPSVSSMSTVMGTVLSQQNYVPRSQSDHRHETKQSKRPIKRLSAMSAWSHVQTYSHIVRNLRYSSKYKAHHGSNMEAVPHAGTWESTLTSNLYSTINPPPSTTNSYLAAAQSYAGSRTLSSSRREEGCGHPNTPVSSVTEFTTDTEEEKEKWV